MALRQTDVWNGSAISQNACTDDFKAPKALKNPIIWTKFLPYFGSARTKHTHVERVAVLPPPNTHKGRQPHSVVSPRTMIPYDTLAALRYLRVVKFSKIETFENSIFLVHNFSPMLHWKNETEVCRTRQSLSPGHEHES